MSDVPFGFGPAGGGDDRDRPERRDEPQNPLGFGAMPGGGAFDVNQLGQMLTQLGQMLSQAQSSGGGRSTTTSPRRWRTSSSPPPPRR